MILRGWRRQAGGLGFEGGEGVVVEGGAGGDVFGGEHGFVVGFGGGVEHLVVFEVCSHVIGLRWLALALWK